MMPRLVQSLWRYRSEYLAPYYNGPANTRYQSRHKLLNLNPDTGVGWTVADMANIEIGFSITG